MKTYTGHLPAFLIALCFLGSPTDSLAAFDQTHAQWSSVLKSSVVQKGLATQVNYKAIKANPVIFEAYLSSLSAVTDAEFLTFTENQKLAFLINGYNAFTVKLIVDNYPVKSIRDLGSVFSSAWKKKFFKLFGLDRNLDNVEHDMIRKSFNEPRIHFAVVCASVGCPALRVEAYQASRLEAQLESAAHDFLSDTTRNRFLSDSKKLEISSIFKWYGDDFVKKFGSLEAFLADRFTTNESDRILIRARKVPVRFLDYDWSLNELK